MVDSRPGAYATESRGSQALKASQCGQPSVDTRKDEGSRRRWLGRRRRAQRDLIQGNEGVCVKG
jgi:hypothetical protein